MDDEQCPACLGRGSFYRGTEPQTGMGGTIDRPVYEDCAKCGGSGRVHPDAFTSALEARIEKLEAQVKSLERYIETSGL